MKSEKSWQEESKEQLFIKNAVDSNKDYEFKDFFKLIEKSEEFTTLKGLHISQSIKNLRELGELVQLKKDGTIVYRSTKGLEEALGTVQWQTSGFALLFVENEQGKKTGETIYLNRKEAARVLNGEKIKVKRIPSSWFVDKKNKEDEGIVIDVLETSPCYTIGENVGTSRNGWLGAVRLCERIFTKVIRLSEKHEARNNPELNKSVLEKGNIISGYLRRTGKFDRHSSLRAFFDVKNVLGKWSDPEIETKVALDWMKAEDKFVGGVLSEAYKVSNISSKELLSDNGRKDLRNIAFVTIDGASTKDFDDALAAQKNPDGSHKIFVAIADVSRYVKTNSILDKIAQKRSTSLYMPHKTISMFPDILSTGICSLNPGLERAALVFEANVSKDGTVSDKKFYPALVKSHDRLIYGEVDAFIHDNCELKNIGPLKEDSRFYNDLSKETQHILSLLVKSADVLKGNRNAIEFERKAEIIPLIGENKKAYALKLSDDMTPANKLVEEFMLLVNSEAAKVLSNNNVNNVLYRNQYLPDSEGGILKPAVYENKSSGHYALGTDHYMHFTSPIRRYPDLLAHRALKKVLGYSADEELTSEEVENIGNHCSEIQRLFKGASNKAKQWLILDYAERMKGNQEEVVIIKEIERGWFVYGKDTKIPGFIEKPRSEDDLKKLLDKKLGMEIEGVDYFGEKVCLKACALEYDIENNVNNDAVSEIASKNKIKM